MTAGLALYDAGGRLLARPGKNLSGRGQATWNLEDLGGNTVKAGTYFVRLTGTEEKATTKLIVAR